MHDQRTDRAPTSQANDRKRRPAPIHVTMPDGSTYVLRKVAQAESNAKLSKNRKAGFYTLGISMLPHDMGGFQVCPHASAACIANCLNLSGRTMADTIQTAVIMRYRLAVKLAYFRHRAEFLALLRNDIENARRYASKRGLKVVIRPNVISDIDWARVHPELISEFPDVTWYGYTKRIDAMRRFMDGQYPSNYHLVFSRSEVDENQTFARTVLARGYNVSVVFDTQYTSTFKRPLPRRFWGARVIDGDITDLRFLDPRGVVVGLRGKGKLRQPEARDSGFVVRTDRAHHNPRVID
jgi:hypothetical protein